MEAKGNVRIIPMEEIERCCEYQLPKGTQLKDFLIEADENSHKICMIGIGGGGLNLVETISKNRRQYYTMMAHVDYVDLYERSCQNKLYLLSDVADREILTVDNRRALSTFVKGHKKVYVLTTFGRETHRCEVVEQMVQHLHRTGREVILIVIKPFLFEVIPGRIRAINNSIEKLKDYTQQIIVFHNEDLLGIKKENMNKSSKTFDLMDNIIRLTIEEGEVHGENAIENIYLNDVQG